MRIAEINMTHIGSTGKIMFGIAESARKAGHEVQTFSPRLFMRHGSFEMPEIDQHIYFGYPLEHISHRIFSEITGFHGYLSILGTRQLLKQLNDIKPDVIHLHNLHNWSINIPMLFCYIRKHNIKTVWTLHDCWAFTGQCPHFVMAKCDKWKSGCHECPQTSVYPKSFTDRTRFMWKHKRKWFTGIEDMTIVTPSLWLANLVKQSYLKEYSVQVINNGIDLSVFHPIGSSFRERYAIEGKYLVLGVSFVWGKRKGLDVFEELSRRLPDNYQIILVGTNDFIDEDLPENIISIHRTNNQHELAEIYSAADVFANPTREEVLGMVNAEALACGTPVVTFRTGGSPEIPDESCGSVVECDDVDSMEKEIRYICEQKPFSSEDCLRRAQKFDQNPLYKEYVKLYEG